VVATEVKWNPGGTSTGGARQIAGPTDKIQSGDINHHDE